MSIEGSAARKAPAMHPHASGVGSGRTGRDRRRVGHRGRASRLAPQDIRSFATRQAEVVDGVDAAWDEIGPAPLDGLDPAFDEIEDLHRHVDRLSAWMCIGRALPASHGD